MNNNEHNANVDEQPPSECRNCGGPVDFAERGGDGRAIVLCRGDCGGWDEIRR